ncbi:hypothetical protein CVV68_05880 [Arthrobacter livingstonensis]|uniref:Uncharacterized protein n=2 Tax=Arthrobacter livingstonensis TaxID=670078 RepID=A0A2V5LMC8_9MICC|nr:hypothetical protein CVV68_05880 [Arthrobacter livingstonensis]
MFKKVATPTYLDRNPLKHEGVIAFMAERYPVDLDQGIMRMLQDKVGGYPTGWMLHTYTPALQFIPEDYRELTAASLREYMPEMNDEEVQTVESWDIRELVKSDSRIRDHEVFMNSVRDFDLG